MAQVVVEMSGDEAKLYRSYQRIIDQAKKLDGTTKEVTASSKQAGEQVQQSFGAKGVAALTNYALGMSATAAAARLFAESMAFSKQKVDAAIASVERLIATRSQLQQVAVGPGGGDVQAMNVFANQLSRRGISREEAQSIIFSARSEGFTGQEDAVARLIGANQFKAADIRTLAGQVPTIFGGAVSPMEGIAGAAYGARVSRLNVSEYAAMLPKGAQAASIIGGTPAETMALTAVEAGRSERAMEYAATFAGQLAYGTAGKQFAGLGILGAVQKLGAMPEANRRQLLGTGKEANLIYEWIQKDMPRIKQVAGETQAAMNNVTGYVSGVESMVFDPTTQQGQLMRGRRDAIVEANMLEIQREEKLATGGYARRAAQIRGERLGELRPGGPVSRWTGHKLSAYAEEAGLPASAVESATEIGKGWTAFGAFEVVVSALVDAAQKLGHSADKLDDATGRSRAAAAQQVE